MDALGELDVVVGDIYDGSQGFLRGGDNEDQSRLLQLPDPCLLKVMQCCGKDLCTLFSAARTHSRLHQAAVMAVRSIKAVVNQQSVDGVPQYLAKHGQHVRSIDVRGQLGPRGYAQDGIRLHQLPHSKLQGLSRLVLESLYVQLHPAWITGTRSQGVLSAQPEGPLKRLRLADCPLLDGKPGLAAALSALPGLQHLSVRGCTAGDGHLFSFPSVVLQALQQLTSLELSVSGLQDPLDNHPSAGLQGDDPDGLQHLQHLTCLQELRLHFENSYTVKASMLPASQQLTRLQLSKEHKASLNLHADALADVPQLRHVSFAGCKPRIGLQGGAVALGCLLSQLQQLQQLTHLSLDDSLYVYWQDDLPAASAYSALTASSKLQYLNISDCSLPIGVWQHLFPAGRQLPHLQGLCISQVCRHHDAAYVTAPEGSRIFSCCPGLQSLEIWGLLGCRELLAPLSALSSLTQLTVGVPSPPGGAIQRLDVLCQLTGLRDLSLRDECGAAGLLLQLTQLRQLTHLEYCWGLRAHERFRSVGCKAPDDEPVWRQVLQHHLNHGGHSDPDVAQQAAAALAECDVNAKR